MGLNVPDVTAEMKAFCGLGAENGPTIQRWMGAALLSVKQARSEALRVRFNAIVLKTQLT